MTCRLCSSTNYKNLYVVNRFDIAKCKSCQLVYVVQTPTDQELRALYTEKFFERGKYDKNEMNEAALRENERRLNFIRKKLDHKMAKVLDYGCAYGDFVNFINHEYDAFGTDISQEALENARKKYPSLKGKFISLQDISSQTFDAIFLWDVIEHVPDPIKVVNKLRSLLNPNGYLFISTPNAETLSFHVFRKSWAFMIPPEHLSFFGKKTLSRLLNNDNFEVKSFMSCGKWVNLSFLGYKIKKAFPSITPEFLVKFLQSKFMSQFNVYIPTGDVQYVAAQLRKN